MHELDRHNYPALYKLTWNIQWCWYTPIIFNAWTYEYNNKLFIIINSLDIAYRKNGCTIMIGKQLQLILILSSTRYAPIIIMHACMHNIIVLWYNIIISPQYIHGQNNTILQLIEAEHASTLYPLWHHDIVTLKQFAAWVLYPCTYCHSH